MPDGANITRAALSTGGRAKSNVLSISIQSASPPARSGRSKQASVLTIDTNPQPVFTRCEQVPTIDTFGCARFHPFGNGKPQKRADPATRERRKSWRRQAPPFPESVIHRASVSPEWPLVKAQQKRPVFIGQFGVVARSSKRGRKSPAISRNSLGAGAVARRNRLQSEQT